MAKSQEPANISWESKPCPTEVGIPSPLLQGVWWVTHSRNLIKCVFVSRLQSLHWMWFVCFEFVMELEGTERTAKLFLDGNIYTVQWTWNLFRWDLRRCRGSGRGQCSLPLPYSQFGSPGSSSAGNDFLCNCFSQGNPDEKSTGESTSSPVKHGEEKPIQREPEKTLSQTGQRHRDEKSDSSTRHGSCWVR